MKNEPSILFEDSHILVLNKPSGLLSQGEHKGDPNLVDWLRAYLGRPYVGLIHRLDRNTSGLMVVGKRTKSSRRLTEALQKGELKRVYLAWLCNRLDRPMSWHHWLRKDSKTNKVSVVAEKTTGAQEAVLSVSPVRHSTFKSHPIALAQFDLETGRSHQIRVQSAFEGFPVLGDAKYGGILFARLALHSWKLEFPHPMSGERQRFEAPLPGELLLK